MSDNPPLETQGEIYKDLESYKNLQPGDDVYLISAQWLQKFKRDTGLEGSNPQQISTCGKIDNRPLFTREQFSPKGKREKFDYEILTEDMWEQLHNWYQGGPEIKLKVVESNTGPKVPLINLKLKCYFKFNNPKEIDTNEYIKIKDLRERIMAKFNVPLDKETRLWDYFQREFKNEMKDENELRKYNIYDDQEIYLDIKENGQWYKDNQNDPSFDITQSTIDSGAMGIPYNEYNDMTNPNFNQQNINPNFPENIQEPNYNLNYTIEKPIAPGAVGLNNIGNTCFFNAGLQCLLHNIPLMDAILKNHTWDRDISMVDHMHGTSGALAQAFSELMKLVWSNEQKVINPNKLKNIVGQYAPQFSNSEQQDCHEFLTFLINGLHDDLNRKYSKNSSNQTIVGNGDDDKEIAQKSWDYFKSKNDSIMIDNFYGQFRSTSKCPNCHSVTTVFDPYNIISLPITVHSKGLTVTFIPQNYTEPYVKMNIEIPANLPFQDISKIVSEYLKRDVKVIIGGYRILDEIEWGIGDYSDTSQPHLCAFEVYDYDLYYIPCVIEMSEKNENSNYNYGTPAIGIKKPIGKPFLLSFVKQDPNENEIANCAYNYLRCLWEKYDGTPSDYVKEIVRQKKYYSEPVKESLANYQIVSELPSNYGSVGLKYEQKYPNLEKAIVKINLNPLYMDTDDEINDALNSNINQPNYLNTGAKFSYYKLFCHLKQKKEKSIDYNKPQMDLEECFSIFTKNEILDEKNKWHCPKCNTDVCADKKIDIWSVPDSLIINLKRFDQSNVKLETFVGYDEELDLTDFVISGKEDEQVCYELYGVTEHMGGVGSGHYTAHVKVKEQEQSQGKWYSFNDAEVTEASQGSEINRSAYILFYQRVKETNDE